MGFKGSDLWKVRQKWGSGLLVWPGVTVLVFNDEGQVLLGLRSDNNKWSVVGGFYELGDSAESCARREVKEEFGLEVKQLEMFGVLTASALTTLKYPNGDEVQSPSHLFAATVDGTSVIGDEEHVAFEWLSLDEASVRVKGGFGYSIFAIEAYSRWQKTKEFQIG